MAEASDQLIEDAIRHHALAEWSEFEIEGIVAQVLDLDDEWRDDPEFVAHALWSMGAQGPKHRGCVVDNEATYQNECGSCQKFLLDLAGRIISTSHHLRQGDTE